MSPESAALGTKVGIMSMIDLSEDSKLVGR